MCYQTFFKPPWNRFGTKRPKTGHSESKKALPGQKENRQFPCEISGFCMAPQVGLEPTTLRLTAECSAIELLRNKFRRRPTLPGRVQPSTIGAEGLNFCVRNGNRWDPFAIVTGNVIFSMGPTLKRLPDTLSSVFLKPHCVLCGSILSCTRSRLRIFTTAHCFL